MLTPSRSTPAGVLCLAAVLAAGGLSTSACTSKTLDPRVELDAPYEHRDAIAQFINRSGLWEAYLDYLAPDGATPVVEISLTFDRVITRETNSGDYDPGVVHADLEMRNLSSGSTILTNSDKFAIKDFIFGGYEDATREEVQDAAFASTEKTAMRFVFYTMEMGVIHAMGEEGAEAFIPALEEKAEDPTAGDMAGMAKGALRAIRGS